MEAHEKQQEIQVAIQSEATDALQQQMIQASKEQESLLKGRCYQANKLAQYRRMLKLERARNKLDGEERIDTLFESQMKINFSKMEGVQIEL